ncbi:MAG: DUF4190 domain-containing protein [Demequinaceae bacterium]|nr:DUF4190 domain-containing protein [Demequinaceae bacterium]
MTEDNPYAPPPYPPPTGRAFASPGFEEEPPTESPAFSAGDPFAPSAIGAPTELFGAPTASIGRMVAPMNRSAKRALWLAVMTPVLTPIVGIAAIAVGRRARDEIARDGGRGTGLAGTAVWMGGVLSILWVLGVAFLVAMKAGSIAA